MHIVYNSLFIRAYVLKRVKKEKIGEAITILEDVFKDILNNSFTKSKLDDIAVKLSPLIQSQFIDEFHESVTHMGDSMG